LNKKFIVLSVILVLGLFVINGCEPVAQRVMEESKDDLESSSVLTILQSIGSTCFDDGVCYPLGYEYNNCADCGASPPCECHWHFSGGCKSACPVLD